jgi:hypothetical protein
MFFRVEYVVYSVDMLYLQPCRDHFLARQTETSWSKLSHNSRLANKARSLPLRVRTLINFSGSKFQPINEPAISQIQDTFGVPVF